MQGINACNVEIVQILMSTGEYSKYLDSALLYACSTCKESSTVYNGRVRGVVVPTLLSYGANVNCFYTESKMTPLMYACKNESENVVNAILERKGVDVDMKDKQGNSALTYAATKSFTYGIQAIVDYKQRNKWFYLVYIPITLFVDITTNHGYQ